MFFSLLFLLLQEIFRFLAPLSHNSLVVFVGSQAQPLDAWFNILLLDATLVEEQVVSLQLFRLDQGVDHLGLKFLVTNHLVHGLLRLELGLLKC